MGNSNSNTTNVLNDILMSSFSESVQGVYVSSDINQEISIIGKSIHIRNLTQSAVVTINASVMSKSIQNNALQNKITNDIMQQLQSTIDGSLMNSNSNTLELQNKISMLVKQVSSEMSNIKSNINQKITIKGSNININNLNQNASGALALSIAQSNEQASQLMNEVSNKIAQKSELKVTGILASLAHSLVGAYGMYAIIIIVAILASIVTSLVGPITDAINKHQLIKNNMTNMQLNLNERLENEKIDLEYIKINKPPPKRTKVDLRGLQSLSSKELKDKLEYESQPKTLI